MLEKINLDKKLKRKEWLALQPQLQQRLYDLHRASFAAGMPVIIVFEGWDGAGKGSAIRTLTQRLDPRGYRVWPTRPARTFERNRPWLWRFWLRIPARGEMAIFDRSWYGRVLTERVEGTLPADELKRAARDIVEFERTLADDAYLIVKFWLHISKAEQERRFRALEKDVRANWHVQSEDWEHHWRYKDYLRAADDMFEQTDTEWGPWTIVEATNPYFTWSKIFETVIAAVAGGLRARGIDPDALSSEPVAEDADLLEDTTVEESAYEPDDSAGSRPSLEVSGDDGRKPASTVTGPAAKG